MVRRPEVFRTSLLHCTIEMHELEVKDYVALHNRSCSTAYRVFT